VIERIFLTLIYICQCYCKIKVVRVYGPPCMSHEMTRRDVV